MSNILNFYEVIDEGKKDKKMPYKNYPKVNIKIPNRIILTGSSGSGKTNVLLNLIFSMNCFTKYYLFIKDDTEPLYAFLIKELRDVEKKTGKEVVFVYSDLSKMPKVEAFDKTQNNLVVIDDMILDKNPVVKEIFLRGRKQNISICYLTQSYFSTDKFIRQNTDIVIFKKLNKRDLNIIVREFAFDKKPEDLMKMYLSCNPDKVDSFFMIDNSPAQDAKFKYRCGFSPIEM